MCDYCKGVLYLKHSENNCPYKKYKYCPTCASYGHNYETCENKSRNCKIILESTPKEDEITTYEILDNPKAIRAFLKIFNDLPRKENRDKDKYKKHLKEFEKKRNVKVVLYLIE